jgi:hypothetical protein
LNNFSSFGRDFEDTFAGGGLRSHDRLSLTFATAAAAASASTTVLGQPNNLPLDVLVVGVHDSKSLFFPSSCSAMLQISWTRRQQHREIDQTSVPALETARRGWGESRPGGTKLFFRCY